MQGSKSLFNIYKSENDKTKIILQNVIIMLSNRIYIDANGNKKPLLNVNDEPNYDDKGEGTYVIKTLNGDKYAIKIVFQRITNTGKTSIISEYFKDYAQYQKIIIARDFNNKIADYASKNNTQIFHEFSLLMNLIDYRDQPKFELLSPQEMEMFKEEYNATDYTTKKLYITDPIAKYYNLGKGDIIRIIRPSPTSGYAVDYRIVI